MSSASSGHPNHHGTRRPDLGVARRGSVQVCGHVGWFHPRHDLLGERRQAHTLPTRQDRYVQVLKLYDLNRTWWRCECVCAGIIILYSVYGRSVVTSPAQSCLLYVKNISELNMFKPIITQLLNQCWCRMYIFKSYWVLKFITFTVKFKKNVG